MYMCVYIYVCTYIYMKLNHFAVYPNYCASSIFQFLKIIQKLKKKESPFDPRK